MDPLNNPTPTPTPTPTPNSGPAPEPILPPLSPAPGAPAAPPVPGPATSPVVPGPAPTEAPKNPIINPTGTAPASPAAALGNLEIAATDPIMTAEPPKAPDPVEEELKAPMQAAGPVPGSIGSAVSGPADGVPAGAEMPMNGQPNPFNAASQEKVQNVAFNDPAMNPNPNQNLEPGQNPLPAGNGKKSPFEGLKKLYQEKKTLVILIAVAAVVVLVLAIVLMIQLFSNGSGADAPASNNGDSSQTSDSDTDDDEEGVDEEGGEADNVAELSGIVSCLMEMNFEGLDVNEATAFSSTDESEILIENGKIVSITSTVTTIDENGEETQEVETEPFSENDTMYVEGAGLPYDKDGSLTVGSLDKFATDLQTVLSNETGGILKVTCVVE